jgi:hypothetical protein
MLSPGSLSAFTASFTDAAAVSRARPVRDTREVGRQDSGANGGRPLDALAPGKGASGQDPAQPGMILPRGSLLDLSV